MVSRNVYYTLSLLILICITACSNADKYGNADAVYAKKLLKERINKDKEVLSEGIIQEKDIQNFKELHYFLPDTNFIVQAHIRKLPPIVYTFKTNTDRSPQYFTYCTLEFKIGDSTCHLIAYTRDLELSEGLFIPFKDASAGNETYGGGRYIEMPFDGIGNTLTLDFNRAFNPYCHYNTKYSCPVVPPENVLKVRIAAGEKKYHD